VICISPSKNNLKKNILFEVYFNWTLNSGGGKKSFLTEVKQLLETSPRCKGTLFDIQLIQNKKNRR